MYQASRIDVATGLYLEPVLVEDGVILVDNDVISIPVTEGLHVPKWDGEQWVEGLTTEQLEARQNATPPKTEVELLREENVQLNLQFIDLWETLLGAGVL
jgi:hypothetical protein